MKTLTQIIAIILLGTCCQSAFSEENLGTIIKASGWDKLMGTWVDPETKGEKTTAVFAWKYENQALENITTHPDTETLSLIARNAKTGKIFVASADNVGGSSTGEATFEAGKATFIVEYATHTGDAGTAKIEYTMADDDTLNLNYVMGDSKTFSVTLTRKK